MHVVQVAAAGLSRCVIALHASLLVQYVYAKHTQLSFASWCMLHIHNSASLRGVCAVQILHSASFALLAYLFHIHNSATPRLCIFASTTLSSDVRH